MKLLLDTCTLSELRKNEPNPQVYRFIQQYHADQLYLSVITLGEITKGIKLLAESKRKRELTFWLETLQTGYADKVLPIKTETVAIWGEVTAKAQQNGKTLAAADGLIAATAIEHGLHVITRNVADFEPSGCLLINPWL